MIYRHLQIKKSNLQFYLKNYVQFYLKNYVSCLRKKSLRTGIPQARKFFVMTNVLTLFDFSKFPKRESALEVEYLKDFEKLLPEFFWAYQYAFERMREERSRLKTREINSRWPADAINRHVYSYLSSQPTIAPLIKKEYNTFYLEKGKYKLQFKKLNDQYRPSYNYTKRSSLLERNRTWSSNDDKTVIFVGYKVDSTWSSLNGIYSVSLSDRKLNWAVDMEEMVHSSSSIKTITKTKHDPVAEPEVKLKVKDGIRRKKA